MKGKRAVQISYHALHNPEGKYTGLIRLVSDITAQVEAQEKIEASESKYRKLFENNSAGVYVSTEAGKILNCNEAFANLLGYSSKEEVLKTDAGNLYQNKEERELFIKKLKENKELINYESRAKKKDGSFMDAIENVQLIGENIFQGTIVDITIRKQTEEELKGRNRGLQIFYDADVGRELKVIELKKEINKQLKKAGEKPKYEIPAYGNRAGKASRH